MPLFGMPEKGRRDMATARAKCKSQSRRGGVQRRERGVGEDDLRTTVGNVPRGPSIREEGLQETARAAGGSVVAVSRQLLWGLGGCKRQDGRYVRAVNCAPHWWH